MLQTSEQTPERTPGPAAKPARSVRRIADRLGLAGFALIALVAIGVLITRTLEIGPEYLSGYAAVAVAVSYTWALAVRTGGRPVVAAALALTIGGVVLWQDREFLRNGASVLTALVTALLAVMSTVPAVRIWQAVRELLVASLIAAGGALAVVGFGPQVNLARFEYATLGLGLVVGFSLVYRLGAGAHGLGRRGLAAVLGGGVMLVAILAYAEAIRRYGAPMVGSAIADAVTWSRDYLGGAPRPQLALLGAPALMWGAHMRARRRQGWWVTIFGVVGTLAIANGLMRPGAGAIESLISIGYSLAIGLLIGILVIRLDLRLTGPRGPRARRAEESTALRPEPKRFAPLL